MSYEHAEEVRGSLEDAEYRREWADEHISVGLAFQIRALREANNWTQTQLGKLVGNSQTTVSEWEDPNYGRYTLSTLKKLAAAFDVGLFVRFVPFSELIAWTVNVTPERLAPANFEQEAANTDAAATWGEGDLPMTADERAARLTTERIALRNDATPIPLKPCAVCGGSMIEMYGTGMYACAAQFARHQPYDQEHRTKSRQYPRPGDERVIRALDALAAAESREAALREALAPLAAVDISGDGGHSDDWPLSHRFGVNLTVGDIRRARQVLAEPSPTAGDGRAQRAALVSPEVAAAVDRVIAENREVFRMLAEHDRQALAAPEVQS